LLTAPVASIQYTSLFSLSIEEEPCTENFVHIRISWSSFSRR
jgi:hypothetical protein